MTLPHNIDSVKFIFEALAAMFSDKIAYVIYGDAERVSEKVRNEIKYPLFHYDVFNNISYGATSTKTFPSGLQRDSRLSKSYECYFEVLGNSELKDDSLIDAIESMTDTITDLMILALKLGTANIAGTIITIVPENIGVTILSKEMIRRAYGDNDTGFRVNLNISHELKCESGCEPSSNTKLYDSKKLHAAFAWEYISGQGIAITDQSTNSNPAAQQAISYAVWYSHTEKGIAYNEASPTISIHKARQLLISQTVTDANGHQSKAVTVIFIQNNHCETPTILPICGKVNAYK